MTAPTFEWSPAKDVANLKNHGVSSEEAVSVFQDPLAKVHHDPDYSLSEHRDILVGHSTRGRLLLVGFTDREGRIRIISGRKATRRERQAYEEKEQDLPQAVGRVEA